MQASALSETLLPDAEEARDNAAFDAILRALSLPGDIFELPEGGVMTAAQALIDRECRVYAPEHAAAVQATGARLSPVGTADHAIMQLTPVALVDVAQLSVGSELHPEGGATIIAPARLGAGERLRLTGPGIRQAQQIALDGIAPAFWSLRELACTYPLGFELILVDGARVLALPRSTRVEVP
ncbi:phosphonate C-P lyase system protein PhnH [Paracoccus suum]|uniref:Phosphonate C-P lyase system protein PhnH n=1 Tax=Paracoccus suum TaxID=2259340 RepID=A0A344PJB0_9RHOB|nr:phosphonate C-P lyase system protein PhnH [Paracoccus suum]AXC49465.1 phosphonate C-P lyase system protein PhnH [Paracoccus suum]